MFQFNWITYIHTHTHTHKHKHKFDYSLSITSPQIVSLRMSTIAKELAMKLLFVVAQDRLLLCRTFDRWRNSHGANIEMITNHILFSGSRICIQRLSSRFYDSLKQSKLKPFHGNTRIATDARNIGKNATFLLFLFAGDDLCIEVADMSLRTKEYLKAFLSCRETQIHTKVESDESRGFCSIEYSFKAIILRDAEILFKRLFYINYTSVQLRHILCIDPIYTQVIIDKIILCLQKPKQGDKYKLILGTRDPQTLIFSLLPIKITST